MTLFVIKNLKYKGYVPDNERIRTQYIHEAKTFKLEFKAEEYIEEELPNGFYQVIEIYKSE